MRWVRDNAPLRVEHEEALEDVLVADPLRPAL